MAIEIGEMVIRASTGQAVQAKAEGAEPDRKDVPGGTQDMEQMKKMLLAECREMILEILAQREER